MGKYYTAMYVKAKGDTTLHNRIAVMQANLRYIEINNYYSNFPFNIGSENKLFFSHKFP